MMELILGVAGTVTGLVGLGLTHVGYRNQRRQGQELEAREQHLREREQEAERREVSLHASTLRVEVSHEESSLDTSARVWKLTVTNGSNQPFTQVTLRYGDQVLASPALGGLLGARASITQILPGGGGEPDPAQCVVEMTDIAGHLWRRHVAGNLYHGHRNSEGRIVWDSDEPSFVHVIPLGPATMDRPPLGLLAVPGIPALVVVVIALAALAVWYFAVR
ncbi:hypothetical protein [Embleya sp. NPDC059259]|uniref:hypothetical protein n=1 Tax=unclassified Embleya TaxID=2699296 RepID=UPI0036A83BCA